MRRLALLLALLALALVVPCVLTGGHLLGAASEAAAQARAPVAPVASRQRDRTVHAVAGYGVVGLAGLAASAAFAIGLQGLLERGGRAAAAGLLAVLAPVVMALSLAAALTGRVATLRAAGGAGLHASVDLHALRVAAALPAGLLVLAALAWWLSRGRDDQGSGRSETR